MKEITINERGIFLQDTRPLTVKSILRRRTLCQTTILDLRRKIQNAQIEITRWQTEIANVEQQLKSLNSPVVESYIEKERQEAENIQRKAELMLRELIGDSLFQELQLKKRVIFQAKDNMVYKIDFAGRIYRKVGRQYQRLCIIRPNGLPLPDFLSSLFISIREEPQSYRLRRR